MRLIDADAFKKVLSEHEMKHDKRRSFDDYDCGAANAYEHASDLLDEMPTVERPQGEWLKSIDSDYHTCSACKMEILKSAFDNFCPNCGLPMNKRALEILCKREGSE